MVCTKGMIRRRHDQRNTFIKIGYSLLLIILLSFFVNAESPNDAGNAFNFPSTGSSNTLSSTTYLPLHQSSDFDLVISSNNATQCNLTYITYPNGKTLYNTPLTKTGTTFSLLIRSGNYSQLGAVCHGIVCTDGTTVLPGTICRQVTPSGFVNTISFLFLFISIIALIMILGFHLKNKWLMTLGSILILLLGFFIIVNGIGDIKDTRTTWGVGWIVVAIGLYAMILSAEEQLKEWG